MQHWLSRCVVASSVAWSLPAWAADGNAEGPSTQAGAAGSAQSGAGAAGASSSGAGESGGPLPALPSTGPAYYDTPPMPPPLQPQRRFRWGAEFRLEGAPMGSGA